MSEGQLKFGVRLKYGIIGSSDDTSDLALLVDIFGPDNDFQRAIPLSEDYVEDAIDRFIGTLSDVASSYADTGSAEDYIGPWNYPEIGIEVSFHKLGPNEIHIELIGCNDPDRYSCGVLKLDVATYIQLVNEAEEGVNTVIRDELLATDKPNWTS